MKNRAKFLSNLKFAFIIVNLKYIAVAGCT